MMEPDDKLVQEYAGMIWVKDSGQCKIMKHAESLHNEIIDESLWKNMLLIVLGYIKYENMESLDFGKPKQ